MGYEADKSTPKVINRDFPKNEFFPLWHPVLPPVRVASAAKQTSIIILLLNIDKTYIQALPSFSDAIELIVATSLFVSKNDSSGTVLAISGNSC